jgi:hypothetical protein
MLRISKRLFDCPQFKAIANFDAEISRYLESVCLPFEKSIHLCPLPMLQQVDTRLKEFAGKRPELVEAFVAVSHSAIRRPTGFGRYMTRGTFCRSTGFDPRSRSPGVTSVSVCRRSYGRSLPSCGKKNATKSRN